MWTKNKTLHQTINGKRAKETINKLGLTLADKGPAPSELRKVIKRNEEDIRSSLDQQVMPVRQPLD